MDLLSTLEMTPRLSIRSNTCLTSFTRCNATRLGVDNAYGSEPGFSLMLNSPFNSPRPLTNLGICF